MTRVKNQVSISRTIFCDLNVICAMGSIQVTSLFFVIHFNSPFYSQLFFNQMLFFLISLYPNTFTDSARISLSVLFWFGFLTPKKAWCHFLHEFTLSFQGAFLSFYCRNNSFSSCNSENNLTLYKSKQDYDILEESRKCW